MSSGKLGISATQSVLLVNVVAREPQPVIVALHGGSYRPLRSCDPHPFARTLGGVWSSNESPIIAESNHSRSFCSVGRIPPRSAQGSQGKPQFDAHLTSV